MMDKLGKKKKNRELLSFLGNIVKPRLTKEEYNELRHLIDNLLINAMVESFFAGENTRRADDGEK